MSLCSDDLLKPHGISAVVHVTKKLMDQSGSRQVFLAALEKSITDENHGVRLSLFVLSVRELAIVLSVHVA